MSEWILYQTVSLSHKEPYIQMVQVAFRVSKWSRCRSLKHDQPRTLWRESRVPMRPTGSFKCHKRPQPTKSSRLWHSPVCKTRAVTLRRPVVQIHQENIPSDSDGGGDLRHGRVNPAIVGFLCRMFTVCRTLLSRRNKLNKRYNIRY